MTVAGYAQHGLEGFSRHESGLLVPEEHKRTREVWTRDEVKAVMKALAILERRGIANFMGCSHPGCETAPLERHRNLDGSITMRCNHKDRILSRAIK